MKINGTEIETSEFAWDGCHKIYIITDPVSRDELESYGYDFLPIEDLKIAWDSSCPLRFISNADLGDMYVPQFHEGKVSFRS